MLYLNVWLHKIEPVIANFNDSLRTSNGVCSSIQLYLLFSIPFVPPDLILSLINSNDFPIFSLLSIKCVSSYNPFIYRHNKVINLVHIWFFWKFSIIFCVIKLLLVFSDDIKKRRIRLVI